MCNVKTPNLKYWEKRVNNLRNKFDSIIISYKCTPNGKGISFNDIKVIRKIDCILKELLVCAAQDGNVDMTPFFDTTLRYNFT